MVALTDQELVTVVNTLKKVNVKGYNSMDRIVGLVIFFEQKAAEARSVQVDAVGHENKEGSEVIG